MKLYKLSGLIFILAIFSSLIACEDETTTIGSVISSGEVVITIDTIDYKLNIQPIKIESFNSKTGNLMIGKIQQKSYGDLNCSFVTRLMCAANLGVDDSLFYSDRVDSCKLILGATRNGIVGDSLAPQRLSVYKLTKQLPSDINNLFDPEGYYNPNDVLASRSYTVSQISSSDSSFYNNSYVELNIDLPVEFGKEIFDKYKNNPEIFQWPQTMAKEFLPGLFVKPTFGNGCIANITSVYVAVFYYSLIETTVIEDNDTTVNIFHENHMTIPFTVSPEVLSSNNISYSPSENIINKNNEVSDGELVITTPGGYIGEFTFPADDLIKRFSEKNIHLSTVNDLALYLPAETYDSSAGLDIPQNLLLVKSSEYESFFDENKIPDNLSSFIGVYDASNARYYFASMRNYFIDLMKKGEVTEEDVTFRLIPVEITTESSNSYYNETTYIVKCSPFTSKPTMTLIKSNEAKVVFSFSTQFLD